MKASKVGAYRQPLPGDRARCTRCGIERGVRRPTLMCRDCRAVDPRLYAEKQAQRDARSLAAPIGTGRHLDVFDAPTGLTAQSATTTEGAHL